MLHMAVKKFTPTLVVVVVLFTGCTSLDDFYFQVEPSELVVEKHQSLLWNCSAVGEPPISYIWFHDGDIINSTTKQVLQNGTLFIDHLIPRRDSGKYRCCAINTLGMLCGKDVNLTIANLPHFTIHPTSTNVTVGSTARFECFTPGSPPPVILWRFNRIQINSLLDRRYTAFPQGVLHIDNVTSEDEGEYRCVASNIARFRQSNTAILRVIPRDGTSGEALSAPEIITPPQSQVKAVGEYAGFECLANNPKAVVTWSRADNQPIRRDNVGYLGRHNLFFISVQLRDAGLYVCTVTINGVSARKRARLTVYDPPRIPQMMAPTNIINEPVGSIARFQCHASGTPMPTIKWMFQGEYLYPADRKNILESNDLTISVVRTSDKGIYQCVASNAAGTAIASAILFPAVAKNVPDAPFIVDAYAVSSRTIRVFWQAPSNQDVLIIAYSIHFMAVNGKEAHKVQNPTTNSTEISELHPYTEYSIYCQSWTQKGPSEPSNVLSVHTLEDVPSSAPVFSATSGEPTSINLSWSSMDVSSSNGIVTHYVVSYTAAEEDDAVDIDVDGSHNEYKVTGLTPQTEYMVRIAAVTSAGAGVFSNWVHVTTTLNANDTRPLPPRLLIVPINDTTMEIHVSLDENNENIIGIKLTVRDNTGVAIAEPVIMDPSTTVKVISGLDANSVYEVSVLALSRNGESSETLATCTIPRKGNRFPVLPPRFNTTSLSSTRVSVKWCKPVTPFEIVGYTIKYFKVVPHNSSTKTVEFTPIADVPTYELILEDLSPFTFYKVQMRSRAAVHGEGMYSSPEYFRTHQDKPSPPSSIEATALDSYSIEIKWMPPEKPNGVITHYIILYNMDLTVPEYKWRREQQNGSAHYSMLSDLQSNTNYYVKVLAGTLAGEGPPTKPVRAQTMMEPPASSSFDEERGILIGVILAVTCIIICSSFVLMRYRYPCKRQQPSNVSVVYSPCCNDSPHIVQSVGYSQTNGYTHLSQLGDPGHRLPNGKPRKIYRCSADDPDTLLPMLPNGHVIFPTQGIKYIGQPLGPVGDMQATGSDLSNHSASSGFVDTGSTSAMTAPTESHAENSNELAARDSMCAVNSQEDISGIMSSQGTNPAEFYSTTPDNELVHPHAPSQTKQDASYSQDNAFLSQEHDQRGTSLRYEEPELSLVEKMLRSTSPEETEV